MHCPYLICHGGSDVLSVEQATKLYAYSKERGVDVTMALIDEVTTCAEHC